MTIKTVIPETEYTHTNKTIIITLDTYRDVSSIEPLTKPEQYFVRFWVKVGVVRRCIGEHEFSSYDKAYSAYREIRDSMREAV